jgi:hypothetical protein
MIIPEVPEAEINITFPPFTWELQKSPSKQPSSA